MQTLYNVINIIIFIAGWIFFITYIIYYCSPAQKRRKEWEQFAKRHGFKFQEWDTIGILNEYYIGHSFFVGKDSKNVFNLCWWKKEEKEIYTFDYRCSASQTVDIETILLISSPFIWKSMSIQPQFFNKLNETFGLVDDDVDFESAEFSRYYYVKCKDKKFAYDIIHPRVMEILLQAKPLYIETWNKTVLFRRDGKLPVSEMESLLKAANEFIDLIPEYMKKQG